LYTNKKNKSTSNRWKQISRFQLWKLKLVNKNNWLSMQTRNRRFGRRNMKIMLNREIKNSQLVKMGSIGNQNMKSWAHNNRNQFKLKISQINWKQFNLIWKHNKEIARFLRNNWSTFNNNWRKYNKNTIKYSKNWLKLKEWMLN